MFSRLNFLLQLLASPWKAISVVADNLVWGAGIEIGHLVHTPQDVIELGREGLAPASFIQSLQAFFQSLLNGSGKAFPGLGRNLPSQPFGFYALDTNCHIG
jgi:hypothetical protein